MRARRGPLEDAVHNFSIAETQRVLDAAKADKNEHDVRLLEKVVHAKRERAKFSWQTVAAE